MRAGIVSGCPFPYSGPACVECTAPPAAAAAGLRLVRPSCTSWEWATSVSSATTPAPSVGGVASPSFGVSVVATSVAVVARGGLVGAELRFTFSEAILLPLPLLVAAPCATWFDGLWEGAQCFFVSETEIRARAAAGDVSYLAWFSTATRATVSDAVDGKGSLDAWACSRNTTAPSGVWGAMDRTSRATRVGHVIRPLGSAATLLRVAVGEDLFENAQRRASVYSYRARVGLGRYTRSVAARFEAALLLSKSSPHSVLVAPFFVDAAAARAAASTVRIVRDTSPSSASLCGVETFRVEYIAPPPSIFALPLVSDPTHSGYVGNGTYGGGVVGLRLGTLVGALGENESVPFTPRSSSSWRVGVVWWLQLHNMSSPTTTPPSSPQPSPSAAVSVPSVATNGGPSGSSAWSPPPAVVAAYHAGTLRGLDPLDFVVGPLGSFSEGVGVVLSAVAERLRASSAGDVPTVSAPKSLLAHAVAAAESVGFRVDLRAALLPARRENDGDSLRTFFPARSTIGGVFLGNETLSAPLSLLKVTLRPASPIDRLSSPTPLPPPLLPCDHESAGLYWDDDFDFGGTASSGYEEAPFHSTSVSLRALQPSAASTSTNTTTDVASDLVLYHAAPLPSDSLSDLTVVASSGTGGTAANISRSWVESVSFATSSALKGTLHSPWAAAGGKASDSVGNVYVIESGVPTVLIASLRTAGEAEGGGVEGGDGVTCPPTGVVYRWTCTAKKVADGSVVTSVECAVTLHRLEIVKPSAGVVIDVTVAAFRSGSLVGAVAAQLLVVSPPPDVVLQVATFRPPPPTAASAALAASNASIVATHPLDVLDPITPLDGLLMVDASAQRVFVAATSPVYLHANVTTSTGPCVDCTFHWLGGSLALATRTVSDEGRAAFVDVGPSSMAPVPMYAADTCSLTSPTTRPLDGVRVPPSRPPLLSFEGGSATPETKPLWCVRDSQLPYSGALRLLPTDPAVLPLAGTTCGAPFIPVLLTSPSVPINASAQAAFVSAGGVSEVEVNGTLNQRYVQPFFQCGACAHGVDGVPVAVEVRRPGALPRRVVSRLWPTDSTPLHVSIVVFGAQVGVSGATSKREQQSAAVAVHSVTVGTPLATAAVLYGDVGTPITFTSWSWVVRVVGGAIAGGNPSVGWLAEDRPALFAVTAAGVRLLVDADDIARAGGLEAVAAVEASRKVALSYSAQRVEWNTTALALLSGALSRRTVEVTYSASSQGIDPLVGGKCGGALRSVYLRFNVAPTPAPSLDSLPTVDCSVSLSQPPPLRAYVGAGGLIGNVGRSQFCGELRVGEGAMSLVVNTRGWGDDRTAPSGLQYQFLYRLLPRSVHADGVGHVCETEGGVGAENYTTPTLESVTEVTSVAALRKVARSATSFVAGGFAELPLHPADALVAAGVCLRGEVFVVARDEEGGENVCLAPSCRPQFFVVGSKSGSNRAVYSADVLRSMAVRTQPLPTSFSVAPAVTARTIVVAAVAAGLPTTIIRALLDRVTDEISSRRGDTPTAVLALASTLTSTTLEYSEDRDAAVAFAIAALRLVSAVTPLSFSLRVGFDDEGDIANFMRKVSALMCFANLFTVTPAVNSTVTATSLWGAVEAMVQAAAAGPRVGAGAFLTSTVDVAVCSCARCGGARGRDAVVAATSGRLGRVVVRVAYGTAVEVVNHFLSVPVGAGRVDLNPLRNHGVWQRSFAVSAGTVLFDVTPSPLQPLLANRATLRPSNPAFFVRLVGYTQDGAAALVGPLGRGAPLLPDVLSGDGHCGVAGLAAGGGVSIASSEVVGDGVCALSQAYRGVAASFVSDSALRVVEVPIRPPSSAVVDVTVVPLVPPPPPQAEPVAPYVIAIVLTSIAVVGLGIAVAVYVWNRSAPPRKPIYFATPASGSTPRSSLISSCDRDGSFEEPQGLPMDHSGRFGVDGTAP